MKTNVRQKRKSKSKQQKDETDSPETRTFDEVHTSMRKRHISIPIDADEQTQCEHKSNPALWIWARKIENEARGKSKGEWKWGENKKKTNKINLKKKKEKSQSIVFVEMVWRCMAFSSRIWRLQSVADVDIIKIMDNAVPFDWSKWRKQPPTSFLVRGPFVISYRCWRGARVLPNLLTKPHRNETDVLPLNKYTMIRSFSKKNIYTQWFVYVYK